MKNVSNLAVCLMLTLLTACGGGGGSSVPVSTLPTIITNPSVDPEPTDPSNNPGNNTDPGSNSGNNTDPGNTDPSNNPGNNIDPIAPQPETIEVKRQEIVNALNDKFKNSLGYEFDADDYVFGRVTASYDHTKYDTFVLYGEKTSLSYSDFGIWEKRRRIDNGTRVEVIYKPIHVVREDKNQTHFGPFYSMEDQDKDSMVFRGKAFAAVNNSQPKIDGIEAREQTVIPGTAELIINNRDKSVNYYKATENINLSFDKWYDMQFEYNTFAGDITVKNVTKRDDYVEIEGIGFGGLNNMDVVDDKYSFVNYNREFAGEVQDDPTSPSGKRYGRTEDVVGHIFINYDQRPIDISFGAKRVD